MLVIIGYDVFGVVEVVGLGVMCFLFGDEVWYILYIFVGFGSYVEYYVVVESIVGKKLLLLSYFEVVSLMLVGGMVWEVLVVWVVFRVGEIILVYGGVGGVGYVVI